MCTKIFGKPLPREKGPQNTMLSTVKLKNHDQFTNIRLVNMYAIALSCVCFFHPFT